MSLFVYKFGGAIKTAFAISADLDSSDSGQNATIIHHSIPNAHRTACDKQDIVNIPVDAFEKFTEGVMAAGGQSKILVLDTTYDKTKDRRDPDAYSGGQKAMHHAYNNGYDAFRSFIDEHTPNRV
ncbi:MAG: hypothetical protein H6860_05450 [Rhodospirillales bacterium]|nr:hypothetical protein [Alphaproteobacteria bacterium]MCB9981826.1 hypothetical protein [Rhodospirillales bacterium]USO06531.1 MAG: hypothetical protein H6859_05005 [Rhodospirillales bacterium]HOO82252.1 hypothetical protein [Alphaproteobacteria bacterium]